jgi:hypothetical protein
LTSFNPDNKIQSWFQNFEVKIDDTYIYGLDFNSRFKNPLFQGALVRFIIIYKLNARIHDFEKGTFRWLESRLSQLSKFLLTQENPKQIIFVQHHPSK